MTKRLYPLVVGIASVCSGLACAALTLDATRAPIRTVGSATPGGWNLFSNGELGGQFLFPSTGQYLVRVRAWGSPCAGTWPEMAVVLDGEHVGQMTVAGREPRNYEFRTQVEAGAHSVTAAFLNDLMANGEDRNLYLASIELVPPPGGAEPSLATPANVTAEGRKMEERVLAESDAAIEKNRKAQARVKLLNSKDEPLAGANIAIRQLSHDFLFGCNIYAFDRFKTDAENEAYKQRFAELFNYASTRHSERT